ncbi:alanine--glyoxylate aminotransferase family protein [Halonotius aquaticus]|uniref:Alanine--glyoxylate aminotransferase family protein n=1 Tax=Halonotius aquaticus TaxID=2216978 RepID=A0A3A6PQ75_9EURY|nr:alanine--glyoxylate aminotransferase family protein [Halonotius aquaticus]RJX43890.1 alanine--glyoxylate aminotransferase family protein [Halonotius aquaticus]
MLFTPGPTAVPPEVREAMAEPQPNSAVQPEFAERYDRLCRNLQQIYGTDHDVIVPGGEGILGLEAAIASLVAPGDRVLCIANGLYGEGFADFVDSYDGEAELVSADYDAGYDLDAIEAALADAEEADDPFKLATLVHCETPTGTLNDLSPVLDLLEEYDVLSVVDAVSSLGGTPVPTDRIDVCLGASQKCFSAPPGLTTAAVSDRAWAVMEEREPTSLYTNLLPWRDVSEGFPYTHLDANVAALAEAVSRLREEGIENVHDRHERAAERCRQRGRELGLSLYPDESRASPTVTGFHMPGDAQDVRQRVEADHDIVLATSLGDLADDIIRVGHMGYNADVEKVDRVMDAIADVIA